MMAFYKISESNPEILSKVVKYGKETSSLLQKDFPPKKTLNLAMFTR